MKDFFKKILDTMNARLMRYGIDKAMHFLVAAFLTSVVSPLGLYAMLVMFFVITIASYFKEKYMDTIYTVDDIKFSMYGSIVSIILYLPISWL